jgi:hypothetical protein
MSSSSRPYVCVLHYKWLFFLGLSPFSPFCLYLLLSRCLPRNNVGEDAQTLLRMTLQRPLSRALSNVERLCSFPLDSVVLLFCPCSRHYGLSITQYE